jgi:hypothetical protein
MGESYIVELEPGVYLADYVGDPGRTLVKKLAWVFDNDKKAKDQLRLSRRYKDFKYAKIINIGKNGTN